MEQRIVDQVVVCESSTFRKPCCARCKLDVDWRFEVSFGFSVLHFVSISARVYRIELLEIEHAFVSLRPSHNYMFECWNQVTIDSSSSISSKFRNQVSDNIYIVRVRELLLHNQSLDSDFVQSILKIISLKSWVHIHQDQIGSGACILCQGPFRTVVSIHSDSVTRLETKGDKAFGNLVNPLIKFFISVLNSFLVKDLERMIRPFISLPSKHSSDGFTTQWNVRSSTSIT
mmetsp:Transcript_9660/g.9461  ORF Transcript_9660/g.9461 Transcript_9660/m.9461 type:complete len:230 (+) Transcript_9660:1058-1747(+)